MTDTETEPEEMTPASSEENVSMNQEAPAAVPPKRKHSKYSVMIRRAISALKSKQGCSKRAITKYIINNNTVDQKHALDATTRNLKRMLKAGHLKRSSTGLFRIPARGARKPHRSRGKKGRGRRRNKSKKSKRGRKGRKITRRRKGSKGKKRGRKASKA